MIELFIEGSWAIVRPTYPWEDLPGRNDAYNVYTRHKCSVRVPNQHTITFIYGDKCKACNSPIPDSIKTLIILNNDDDTETHFFTRIQP